MPVWFGLGFTITLRRLADIGLMIWILLRLPKDGYRLGSFPSVKSILGTGEFETGCASGFDGLRYLVEL